MPTYTGLKDFVRGCKKLLEIHGNVPVFLKTGDGEVAPFGIAITMSELLDGEAIVFAGGIPKKPVEFEKGECTD
jgi:hypothetical protein